MDCSGMGFPGDLPWHARIGLGYHAGRGSLEEEFLLSDAFLMLQSAEESFSKMNAFGEEIKKIGKDANHDNQKDLVQITHINHNVAAYSRLCIIAFFSFVEAFVNSVGYDFSLRYQNILSPEQIEILAGKKKGNYLSIEYKIEKFPSILRTDKRSPIIISDPVQLKEPFKSFVGQIKNIRDSSVHYAPLKEAIWRKPLSWLENARSTSKLCINVALEFWNACYPLSGQPEYLNKLDYSKYTAIAIERLNAMNQSVANLKNRNA